MTTSVSVAIATYNGERYLREQLDSIYAQTLRPLEVVVSDDGSSDGTLAILEEYRSRRGLALAVNETRLGLVKNFERVIALCSGQFIALADQDDIWKPEKLEVLVNEIGAYTLVYGDPQQCVDETGRMWVDEKHEHIYRFIRKRGTGKPTRELLAENWVVNHTLMFRRELVGFALPMPSEWLYHDGWLALVATKLAGIKFVDQHLQIYRVHPGSMTYMGERRRKPGWRRIVEGTYRDEWEQKCRWELCRLKAGYGLPLLEEEDRAFIRALMCFYGAGLGECPLTAGLAAAAKVAGYFSTNGGLLGKARFVTRAAICGCPRKARGNGVG